MATRTITVGTAGVPLDREVGGTDLSTDRTAAEMRTALALGTAAVADDGDFVPSGYLDTDTTLAANSDAKVATQKAAKAYVDAHTSTLDEGLSVLLSQVFGG